MNKESTVKRRLAALALAAGTAIGGVMVTPSPAMANDGVCGPGDLCLYQNTLFGGGQWDDSAYVADYSSGDKWWGTSTSINDQASSAKSKYSFLTAYIYEHSWYRGAYAYIGAGGQISVLADLGMNDMASSNDY